MKKEDNNKTPRLIRYGYLNNTVYFVPDNLSLTIHVDPKKEKHPRKRKPTKARLAQIQEDKENIILLFQQNQSDLDSFTSRYDMITDFHHRISQMPTLPKIISLERKARSKVLQVHSGRRDKKLP